MDMKNPQSWVIAVVLVAALLVVVALILRQEQERQSRKLRQHFGPEYERLVAEHGDRGKAEAELRAREKRVQRLRIVPLAPADAARYTQAWGAVQARFVDNPQSAVAEADKLVRDLMVKRGYPMGDFEARAADISVDHPALVETYRSAQVIAARDQNGGASTEDLRKAVVYYRSLFDELLDVRSPNRATHGHAAVHS